MSKEAYYFSHDANARNDIKIIKLRRQLGLEGYGIYWVLIENLRETENYKLPLTSIEDIAFDVNVAKEKMEAVIMNYGLFAVDENKFFSERLLRNMQAYGTFKARLAEGGKKAMSKRWPKDKPEKGGMVL